LRFRLQRSQEVGKWQKSCTGFLQGGIKMHHAPSSKPFGLAVLKEALYIKEYPDTPLRPKHHFFHG
ncbi:MAG: hypothetical protein IJ244_05460, partial [Bacteroidaceae bacterium]|nr:hypothetical protein [Bacteroidaceae bacterium]